MLNKLGSAHSGSKMEAPPIQTGRLTLTFRSQSSDANFRGASSSKAPMSTVHAIVDGAVIEHQPAVVKEVRAAAGGASGIATPNS